MSAISPFRGDAAYETDDWATEVVEERGALPEELEAVDPFPAPERQALAPPLLTAAASAKAVAWNAARHPAASRVDPTTIRTALARYVDLPSIEAAIRRANADGAGVAPGTPPVDAVFVEAVQQFQRKCFNEPKLVDGLVGESTLDSLGLVSSAPAFNTVDRVHKATRTVLRGVKAEVAAATGGVYTPENWFDHMVNIAFLGRTFRNGIHAVLAKKLRIAERHLLAQPAFQGKTPAALGQQLRIVEEHRGARPDQTTSKSVHTAGLAVDINYIGNPWIAGNVGSPKGNPVFTDVISRATLLVGGGILAPEERLTPTFLHRLSSRPTSEIYAVLERYDRYVRDYFTLDGALDGVRLRLLSNQMRVHPDVLARMILPGEGVDAAARRWLRQIGEDRTRLRAGNFGTHREPRRGFLNLDRELVIALRDVAGLAWGAVDFGANASGDMMHFDCRRDGVGRVVARALKKPYVPPQWTGPPAPGGAGGP
jgi:hypothetical protein